MANRPIGCDLAKTIRDAMKRDGRTIYRLSKQAGLTASTLQAFHGGGDLRLASASRLCAVLGLELRPAGANRAKGPVKP